MGLKVRAGSRFRPPHPTYHTPPPIRSQLVYLKRLQYEINLFWCPRKKKTGLFEVK